MTKKMTREPKAKLPEGILESDLNYPRFVDGVGLAYDLGENGRLEFYEVKSGRVDRAGCPATFWCIATLFIGKGRQHADRTYAVRVDDGSLVRVGKGPHVLRTLVVYVAKDRAEALKKYTDLYVAGSEKAGMVRDRISSRRAQGQLERAAGNRSWRWDS